MTITQDELENRFTYHAPKEGQPEKYEKIRLMALGLAVALVDNCPDSRELNLALTHLDSAVMFANAAIARRS